METLVHVFAAIGVLTILLVAGSACYLEATKKSRRARHEREEAERYEQKRQRAVLYRDMFATFRPLAVDSNPQATTPPV